MVVRNDLAAKRLRDVLEFKRDLFLRHHISLPAALLRAMNTVRQTEISQLPPVYQ
jgi:hypothetical protein